MQRDSPLVLMQKNPRSRMGTTIRKLMHISSVDAEGPHLRPQTDRTDNSRQSHRDYHVPLTTYYYLPVRLMPIA